MLLPTRRFIPDIQECLDKIPLEPWRWPLSLGRHSVSSLYLDEDSFVSTHKNLPVGFISFEWSHDRTAVVEAMMMLFRSGNTPHELATMTADVYASLNIQFARGARYVSWPSVDGSPADKIYKKLVRRKLAHHVGHFPQKMFGYDGQLVSVNTYTIYRQTWDEWYNVPKEGS